MKNIAPTSTARTLRMRLILIISALFLAMIMITIYVSTINNSEYGLDPQDPVSIEIWHYYNGPQKIAFDELVTEFNETIGLEKGIAVEALNQGNIPQLMSKLMDSVQKKVGSEEMPNIFAAYADTAYEIDKLGYVAELDPYMSKDELNKYVDSYIDEGRFDQEGNLKIFPVAKSTEIMMVNKTDWDKFAAATGATTEDMSTWERLSKVAEQYYNWTDEATPDLDDGKALFGRDSMANYMIVGSMQLSSEIFEVKEGKVTLHLEDAVLKRLWDQFYKPYIRGYYGAYGKFRSDDAKTGDIIALVGSTTGAAYFPDYVSINDSTGYAIESAILPVPIFDGGKPIIVQQGAGMVVTKSDQREEYAATVFLKWVSDLERNIQYSIGSGYLPVMKAANSMELVQTVIEEQNLRVPEQYRQALSVALDQINSATMYTNKAFEGGNGAREVLEYSLINKANADLKQIQSLIKSGMTREAAIISVDTPEQYEHWVQQLRTDLESAISS